MKKSIVTVLFLALLLINCSQPTGVKLKKGTPAYKLAKEMSRIYPVIDPDLNKELVKCNYFVITAGTFFTENYENPEKFASRLKELNPQRLRENLKWAIEDMGETLLLCEAAKSAGILSTEIIKSLQLEGFNNKAVFAVVSPEEVEEVIQRFFAQNGGEEAALEKMGITLENLKIKIERTLVIKKYLELLEQEIQITEEDLKNAYAQDKTAIVRNIALMTKNKSDSAKTEIKKRMESILQRAKSGEDFATLAKQYSEDILTKESGGLYNYSSRYGLVKSFGDAAFNVPVGQISDIIETEGAYHILKIVDRKKETKSFEEVKFELEKQLLQSKREGLKSSVLEKLKLESNYKTFL